MDDIIDLTGSDRDHEVLTATESGGLLGGPFLHDTPVVKYLDDDERVRYAVRNKKSGVTIDRDGGSSETVEPDDDYQALAVVTDRRLLVVVGMDDGDVTREVPMREVFEARTESRGFLKYSLAVETLDGDVLSFPSRANPADVVDAIDEFAQSWASAVRLLDEANEAFITGSAAVPGDEITGRAAIETVEESLREARTVIEPAGPWAAAYVDDRVRDLAGDLGPLRREVRAAEAAANHAQGQRAWDDGEYETAAIAYETAVEKYGEALAAPGATPSDDQLRRRQRASAAERELLQVWPLTAADAARRKASELEETEDAARQWTATLEKYGTVLDVEWPSADRAFEADRGLIRKQLAAVADDAIHDSYAAGRQHVEGGDERADVNDMEGARERYARARDLFEQARVVASELHPNYLDDLETAIYTAEHRMDGNVPADPDDPDDSVVPALGDDSTTEAAVGDTAAAVTGGGASPDSTGENGAGPEAGGSEEGSASIIEEIKSSKAAKESTADRAAGTVGDAGTVDGSTEADASPSDDTSPGGEPAGSGDLTADLLSLSPDDLRSLVADLWEERGWSTMEFSAASDTVYDIVAIQDGSAADRLLLWTIHRPDGAEVEATVIKRCATARDSSQGSVRATLVTTGRLSSAALRLATELDVTVVQRADLVEYLTEAGLEAEVGRLAAA